jgi:hypothetical protein
VDLRRRLDEILKVGTGEEITEVYEFAVGLVLDYKVLAWKSVVVQCMDIPLMIPHLF